jgi:DNA-binding NarL/FixJ family response regulator
VRVVGEVIDTHRATSVVLADDDAPLRRTLARLLAGFGFDVVGQCETPAQLVEIVRELEPDVAIIDSRMPPTHSTEGLSAARVIRHEVPQTAIVVVSAYVQVEHALKALGAGSGSGYLLKERIANAEAFAEIVERVISGGCAVDPSLVQELVASRRANDPLDALTEREVKVLALMAEGRSNPAIVRELSATEEPWRRTSRASSPSWRSPRTATMSILQPWGISGFEMARPGLDRGTTISVVTSKRPNTAKSL